MESMLTGCITAWYENRTKALQRVVRTAERISGCELPSIQDMYKTQCVKKKPSEPSRTPATLTSYCLGAKTQRMTTSVFLQAVYYPQTLQKTII